MVGTWEDRRTVDFRALGYPATDPWTETLTATATAEIPLVQDLSLRGEVLMWNRTEEHVPDGVVREVVRDGGGGLGGLVYQRSEDLAIKLDYLRLDGGYDAPFAALSYEPDQEGIRFSSQLPLPSDRGGVSLFYKRTREVHPPSDGSSRAWWELWGAAADARTGGGLGAGLGWIDERRWRSAEVAGFESRRQVFTARAYWDLGRIGVAELQYQRTMTDETPSGTSSESTADLYVVQSTLGF